MSQELPAEAVENGYSWRDNPTGEHGGTPVHPERQVLTRTGLEWPRTPDDCPNALSGLDQPLGHHGTPGIVMTCPGCGIDCT